MANTLTGFDPVVFKAQITAAMLMGLPQTAAERPTFYFPTTPTWPPGTVLDSELRPIDPRIRPATNPGQTALQVTCAVEFATSMQNAAPIIGGQWDARALITLLDDDYALVKAAIEVSLAQRRYLIQEMTEVGLGTVTVYQLECFRKNAETNP